MRFHFLILLLTGPPLFRGHSHLLLETNLWGEASPRVSETSLSLGGMYNCTNQCHSWWDPPGTHACTHSCIWACDVPEVVCETKENRWLKESLKENCWRKMEGMRWVGGSCGNGCHLWPNDWQAAEECTATPAHWRALNIFTHPLVCPLSPGNLSHSQAGEDATSIAGKITWNRRWESSNQSWQCKCFCVCLCVTVCLWQSGSDAAQRPVLWGPLSSRTLQGLLHFLPGYIAMVTCALICPRADRLDISRYENTASSVLHLCAQTVDGTKVFLIVSKSLHFPSKKSF